jgi:LIVCS family branched-chain amino acid:cation transporter
LVILPVFNYRIRIDDHFYLSTSPFPYLLSDPVIFQIFSMNNNRGGKISQFILLFPGFISGNCYLPQLFPLMRQAKETIITAFALFSLFFGAGNLILPPLLGFKTGSLWWLVALGFCLSAVLIPILGILAHARLQGTMFDFAKKVSPRFSIVYCYLIYAISVSLPSPRTASVTHEMAVAPFTDSPAYVTSLAYFALVLVFCLNRNKILDLIGKWLTPAILLILLLIIGLSVVNMHSLPPAPAGFGTLAVGILEGYQTFDAIGAVVVGGVILVSLNLKGTGSYNDIKTLVSRSGWLSGLGLFLVYAGLIFCGAQGQDSFPPEISRIQLLSGIGLRTLGVTANAFLSVLVSFACFTTAVGIVTGTADFVKSRFPDAPMAYNITVVIGCVLGVVVGQLNVGMIIAIALPALMFVYPLTIVLILLNVLPERYGSPLVFRLVTTTTLIFSIPDFLGSLGRGHWLGELGDWIPLNNHSLGWVLPAMGVFFLVNLVLWSKGARRDA